MPVKVQAHHEITPDYPHPPVGYANPQVVEKLWEEYQAAQALQNAKISRYGDDCVYFAENYLFGQIGLGWGDGGRNLPLTYTPQIGSVVVFTYTHVAVITNIQNGILTLLESNFIPGQITATRQVGVTDKTIRGFYTP